MNVKQWKEVLILMDGVPFTSEILTIKKQRVKIIIRQTLLIIQLDLGVR